MLQFMSTREDYGRKVWGGGTDDQVPVGNNRTEPEVLSTSSTNAQVSEVAGGCRAGGWGIVGVHCFGTDAPSPDTDQARNNPSTQWPNSYPGGR